MHFIALINIKPAN